MIDRKKKLRIIQISLLFLAIVMILFTYSDRNKITTIDRLPKVSLDETNKKNIFFNIEYSGFDLAGNRYILKSKEAYNDIEKDNLVNMKNVEGSFYFKDNTILKVWSEKALYDNQSLDISFQGDVKAIYQDSKLFAQKAEYSNSKNYLKIFESVKIQDPRGTVIADKVFFDINNKKLNIASINNSKVNTNINLK
tara:strand:+ start:527 stop:1108 length:582 start_codon:yes stop_codon:yes gene_type:complete